jgi:GntR family transcriptional regulator
MRSTRYNQFHHKVIKQSMTLVRENVTSLYEQIVSVLRREIGQGIYEPSGKLPSEAELGGRFGVSRVTIRLAIDKLVKEKLVERKQGKGTFVAAKRLQHGLNILRGFYDSLARQGVSAEMKLLCMQETDVPSELHSVFGAALAKCLYLERLHLVDGHPVALAQTHLLPEAMTITHEQVANTPSYDMLESLLGWHIQRADMAISATAATADIANTLDVKKHSPLLVMKRTSWLDDGRACESTIFYIRPERYEFIMSSTGDA